MLYERIDCCKKSYVMISSVIKLKHKAEVNEEREFLRDVTVSDGGSERSEHGVVVIAERCSDHGALVKQLFHLISVLSSCQPQENNVVLCEVDLCLQLCGQQFIPRLFDVCNACEGSLLFHVMSKPLSSNIVADNERRILTRQETAVEHGLNGKVAAQGERHAPHGCVLAQANAISQLHKIVGDIGETRLELSASRGEVPLVLAIVVHLPDITEEVAVVREITLVLRQPVNKQVAEIVVVPFGSDADIEVSHVEVQRRHVESVLVVGDVITLLTVLIDINVVVSKRIGDGGPDEAHGVEAPVDLSHRALAEAHGEVEFHRHLCAQRDCGIGLQSNLLLIVETDTDADCIGFLRTSGKDNLCSGSAVFEIDSMTLNTIVGALVEEVEAHGGGNELSTIGVDAVALLEIKLVTDEEFVTLRHVYEIQSTYLKLRWRHKRIVLDKNAFFRVADAQFGFQGQQFVPMAHGLFLAAADEGVNGCMGKGSGAVASSVDADRDVGDGEVFLIFVLTVNVDNLRDDSACGTDVVGRLLLALHGDTDDIVSAHLTGNVGREIVAEATVDEHHVAHPDRRECSRDGHTGTHSYAEHTAMEVVLGVVNDIGGHTGKRDGKGVEVDGVVVGCRERIEERIDILTDDKASAIGSPVP